MKNGKTADLMVHFVRPAYLLLMLVCMLLILLRPVRTFAAEDFYNWGSGTGDGSEIDLDSVIDLNMDYSGAANEALEKYQAVFEGAEVRLQVTGWPSQYNQFLTACNFASLELEIADSGKLLYGDKDGLWKLSDVKNLKKLTYIENDDQNPSLLGSFDDLEELTMKLEGDGISLFGHLTNRIFPALKTFCLEVNDPSDLEWESWFPRGLVFPSTLEEVEVLCGGEPVGADAPWNANLVGALAQSCPEATVNGAPVDDLIQEILQEGREDFSQADLDSAMADSAMCAIYEAAVVDDASSSEMQTTIEGPVVIMVYDEGVESDSIEALAAGEDFYGMPLTFLAGNINEAQTAILIYSENEIVGYYYMGNAYQVSTHLLMADPHTGEILSDTTVAVNDPPDSIEVTTVNGVQAPKSGYGIFEVEKAIAEAAARIPGVVGADGQAGPDAAGASDGTSDAEAESVMAVLPIPDDALTDQILTALGQDLYKNTLDTLKSGTAISAGYKGEAGSGLQQMLVDFGCDISIDGAVGNMTIGALHQVQEALGLEMTDVVDSTLFKQLLPVLLAANEPETAPDLLQELFAGQEDYLEYLKGSALALQGKYYSAKEAFEASGYGDSASRAEACAQEWPESGELWRSSLAGSELSLTFSVNSMSENSGMCFYIYRNDGTLMSILFQRGSGSVTTWLGGGTYRVKDGTGREWYGTNDAFGRGGSYSFMVFDEEAVDPSDAYKAELTAGYEYTVSINVSSLEEDSTGVGSDDVSWDDWV